MKTIQRINVYNTEDKIVVGYLDTETETSSIENLNLIISELTQDQQNLTNLCVNSIQSALEEGQSLYRSLMQITYEQHGCEERVWAMYNIDNSEEQGQTQFTYAGMNDDDKVKYDDFKSMCDDILQS